MKKGFTLIELLAVIIILGIIALIAIPIVLNIIEDSKKTAYKNEVYSIIRAAHLYNNNKQIEGEKLGEEIIKLDNSQTKLDVSIMPGVGEMKITEDGEVTLALNNGRYCARKIIDRDEVVITEDLENCILPVTLKEIATTSEELGVTSIDNCMLNGICEPGTAFAIKVNDNEVKKFYVLSESEDEVTLIMSENTSSSAWGINAFVSNGPTVILSKLEEDTENWINIPRRNYKVVDDSGYNKYKPIDTYMRARLLTYTEAYPLCENYCPSYIRGYYWLSTTYKHNSGYVSYNIYNTIINGTHANYTQGVRPVITLVKNKKNLTLVDSLELEINDVTTVSKAPFTMSVSISPKEANNKNLKWSSNNTNIVEVTQDGIITGKSAGNAIITVETTDGSNIKEEINITILESQKLSNVVTISEELEVTEVNSCATTGTCELGTAFAIKVNDIETYKFYVISDDETNVTLIMSENLPQKSAWSKNNNNTSGPLPLLNSIKTQTDGWTNIPLRIYNLNDDKSKPPIYPSTIIEGSRARLLTYTEANLLGCTSSSCPEYLLSSDQYWLSTAGSSTSYAWVINASGLNNVFYTTNVKGVRPVITLLK